MSSEEQIAKLIRERDLARVIAVEAMRTMTDGQLAELRCVLDKGNPERAEVDNHQLST